MKNSPSSTFMTEPGFTCVSSICFSIQQVRALYFFACVSNLSLIFACQPAYPVLFPTTLSLHHLIARHTTVLLSELGFSFFVRQRVPNLVLKAQLKLEDGFPGCFNLLLVFSFLASQRTYWIRLSYLLKFSVWILVCNTQVTPMLSLNSWLSMLVYTKVLFINLGRQFQFSVHSFMYAVEHIIIQ